MTATQVNTSSANKQQLRNVPKLFVFECFAEMKVC